MILILLYLWMELLCCFFQYVVIFIKTAKSHKNLAKHLLFKIVSYRHNFTHLVVRRLYYNIYTVIYNFSIHDFFFISSSIFFRASLVLNFEPIFSKFLSCPTFYPSNICLKFYLGLVPPLSTFHSFVATIIYKINSSQN